MKGTHMECQAPEWDCSLLQKLHCAALLMAAAGSGILQHCGITYALALQSLHPPQQLGLLLLINGVVHVTSRAYLLQCVAHLRLFFRNACLL